MKILHVAPSFFPATFWGGPIWSTKAICDGISALPDADLRVLTTDAAGPAARDRVMPAQLPYPATYARRVAGNSIAPSHLFRLPAAIARADVVHLTAAYSAPTLPTFALCKAFGKPLVWSPRGALQATQDWVDAPNQRRKRRYETALNAVRPAHVVMHVTATAEAAQSIARFAGMETQIIPNAVVVPAQLDPVPRDPAHVRLIFLGRLHAKKGLVELFTAMSELPDRYTLDVYGAGTSGDTAQLREFASLLGTRVRFHGHVEGAAKTRAFANADLFVLPSHSENFGIAVAEALAHGVPVLTTTATPWQAVDRRGCGRCIRLGKDNLAHEIAALAARDLPAMGARGRAWIAADFSPDAMVQAFARLYRDLATAGAQEVLA